MPQLIVGFFPTPENCRSNPVICDFNLLATALKIKKILRTALFIKITLYRILYRTPTIYGYEDFRNLSGICRYRFANGPGASMSIIGADLAYQQVPMLIVRSGKWEQFKSQFWAINVLMRNCHILWNWNQDDHLSQNVNWVFMKLKRSQ